MPKPMCNVFVLESSQWPKDVSIIMLFFLMRKLEPRMVKYFAQGHQLVREGPRLKYKQGPQRWAPTTQLSTDQPDLVIQNSL